jgi:hypothetical protein
MIEDEISSRLSEFGDRLDQSRQRHERRATVGDRRSATGLRHRPRLAAIAGAMVLLGLLAVGLIGANLRRSPSELIPASSTPTSEPTPSFRGSDLETSLPLVGRAWLDSMEFSLDRRTNARIYDVWQAAIASCMHDRGLDYEPVPYPENGSYEDQVNPLDRAYATVMGYHPLPAAPVDPNISTEATATAAGDCSNAVYPSTFGRLGNYSADADQLRSDLANTVTGFEADDASHAVTQAWAHCMGNAGYTYRSRKDPIAHYQEAVTITENEIATRLVDLDCDIEVGYTQAQHDWEAPRVAEWETSNREAIQTAIAERTELLDRLSKLEIDLFGSPRN